MPPPRLLADEMVGRLARYLRLVGCDTLYVRGAGDAEIAARARREDRVVLTRDRALSRLAPRALLLTSPHIAEQWRAVRAAYPEVPTRVQPVRCTDCNGLLERWEVGADVSVPEAPGVPWDRVRRGLALYRCRECAHVYWEGTHTAGIDRRLAEWEEAAPRDP